MTAKRDDEDIRKYSGLDSFSFPFFSLFRRIYPAYMRTCGSRSDERNKDDLIIS